MGVNFLFIGIILGIFGVSLFLPARKARKQDEMRQAWPTDKGTVISSEVVAQPPLSRMGKQVLQFDAVIQYQFRYGGQLHFGSGVVYPRHLFSRPEAEALVAGNPAGATVEVHHNPDDIRESYLVLEPTAQNYRTSIAVIVVGVVVALAGILIGFG
jgi:hypothetical protein